MRDTVRSTTLVLDKGYVRLIDIMGSDLSVVNAARASFNKSSTEMNHRNEKLIEYLVKNKHDSPLRHAYITLEFYAPLMVARQAWKHVVGVASIEEGTNWNESSRRYITEEPEFYIPDYWRAAPENAKQGSGGPIGGGLNEFHNQEYQKLISVAMDAYNKALEDGIAVEQARLFLPAYAMYVRWRWTASLNSLLNFASLRLGDDAQWEIHQYASAVYDMVRESFPVTTTAWEKYRV